MVTASAGVPSDLSKVVHSSYRSICHSFEPQTSTVRVSSPRPKCLGHRCSEHKLDGLPDHRNSHRLARDALVLGPSAAPNRDPTPTSSVNNSSRTVPQLAPTTRLLCGGGRENCCPSEIINKDHLQVKVGPI